MRRFGLHRIGKKTKFVLAVAGLSLIAVVAVAYWTGGGSGSGTADVGTSGSVTLTATVTPGIHPGTTEPVSFAAANATDSPIQVTDVHLASITVDTPHAACATDDFGMVDVTESHQVPAGAAAEALPNDGTLTYANTAVNQDACKGATLTLNLTSN